MRKFSGFSCFGLLFGISFCFYSCGQYRAFYRHDDKEAYQAGQLSQPLFDSLKHYLFMATGKPVRDTIIIKFDFNHETCWDLSDSRKNAEIDAAITRMNNHNAEMALSRGKMSMYQFRETGRDFNKIKYRNDSIMIDNGFLGKLLFKQKTVCGTSAIIDPAGRYLLMKSDSHFEALYITSEKFSSFF